MKQNVLIAALIISTISFAQKKKPDNWQTLDPSVDNVYGTGAEEAYKTLKDKKSKTVIVAVIDGGVDPNHEDLKEVIWTNPKEIADNGIDDDHNGYIDDVHGWNFIGGKNGEIDHEASELARIYQRGNRKFSKLDTTKLTGDDVKQFDEFKKIRTAFVKEQTESEEQLKQIQYFSDFLESVKKQNNGVLDKAAFKKYVAKDKKEKKLTKRIAAVISLGLIKAEELETQVKEGLDQISNSVKYNKMNADSIRTYLVGDDIDNVNERYYGNNHYQGPDALHGTHVSGIIAAIRNNSKGINGIANDVKIMIVRAVPDGDERDKDIANGIRYAVDNGATIINMSFGKYYSPDKKVVDEAVKYAESKDVLLVHGCGNESKNNDLETSFPSRHYLSGDMATNWISVGASSAKSGKSMIASFSNYGSKEVDLFAPGVDIYSTIPDNKYISESGTSMASPSAAGAAAIIREYFPELKASEVRNVLIKTVTPYSGKVIVPGTKKTKKKMNEISISGGFINANNAAMELMGLNKKK